MVEFKNSLSLEILPENLFSFDIFYCFLSKSGAQILAKPEQKGKRKRKTINHTFCLLYQNHKDAKTYNSKEAEIEKSSFHFSHGIKKRSNYVSKI